MLAAVAALFLAGYVGVIDNWTGRGLELESIAGAVLGGASLRGGKATVVGSLLGALILVMLFNIMLMLGLPIELQLVVQGLVIVTAAALYATGGSRD